MKTNCDQMPVEKLIDLVLGLGTTSELVHLTICTDCLEKYKGLQLSLYTERTKDVFLTNEEFKTSRIKEIKEIGSLYGDDSIAVDMTIKCGLQLEKAGLIFSDLA